MRSLTLPETGGYHIVKYGQRKASERKEAWRKDRYKGIGGSDMSVVLGISKFKTPYQLWLEKTKKKAPEDISGKWAVVKGNALENTLRQRFRRIHPEWQITDGTDRVLIRDDKPFMRASIDGAIHDPATGEWGVLEIKTAGSRRYGDWHDEDGDLKVPDYYIAQVTYYLAVTGWKWGIVYADLSDGSDPVELRVERDEDDIRAVERAAEEFWGFVATDTMPELKSQSDVLTAFPEPVDDGIVDMGSDEKTVDLMRAYATAKAAKKTADEAEDRLKQQLIVKIGGASGIKAGGYRATYKAFNRAAHMVQASSGRRFTFEKPKEKKNKGDK